MPTGLSESVRVADLMERPDADHFELINGELVERNMSPISGYIAGELYANLRDYLRANPIGIAFPDNVGFTLLEGDETQLRKPDASVVLLSRLPGGVIPSTRFDFSPDLAVEVLSPTDLYADVEEKIEAYLNAGTQIVWVAIPQTRRIRVIRADRIGPSFGEGDILTAEPLLPGFQLLVGSVFPPKVKQVTS